MHASLGVYAACFRQPIKGTGCYFRFKVVLCVSDLTPSRPIFSNRLLASSFVVIGDGQLTRHRRKDRLRPFVEFKID
jgi:hypothetical protein